MSAFIPVVLCGGAGTRLWPLSREALPKPFIKLADGESLLAKTLRRASALPEVARLLIVTNRDYYFLALDEIERLGGKAPQAQFLLEPAGRNTAPAICAAALHAARTHGEESVLLMLPADHLVNDAAGFAAAVREARRLAEQDWLVTFGIAPTAPATGFGYVEAGEALGEGACKVARFVEKPDLQAAERYLASGRFAWNSGMFCFRAGAVLAALRAHAPRVFAAVERAVAETDFGKTPPVLAAARFAEAPDVSFDYAVMEKASNAAMVRGRFDWSDIGSWNAVAELTPADARGNRVNGEAVLGPLGGVLRAERRPHGRCRGRGTAADHRYA
jgi:mannose-1-phosphate guanylyltransferase/mannose-6-phosphate isomerase